MDNKVQIKKITPAFEDERGIIMDILDDENIQHIGLITAKPSAVRGNHYHNKAKQYNYILKGKVEVIIHENKDAEPQSHILEKGDFIFIPAGIIHTIKAIEDTVFLDFNTESRSGDGYEQDTVRV